MPACVLSSCGLQGFAEWRVALQGRFFDFGNKKARDQPLDVDVASGVPCGVAARRGMVLHSELLRAQLRAHLLQEHVMQRDAQSWIEV